MSEQNNILFLLNKINNLMLNKSKLINESIDNKKGNVSKDEVRNWIKELTEIVSNEKNSYELSVNTPTNGETIVIDSQIPVENQTNQIHMNDNQQDISTQDRTDQLIHQVKTLTTKVEQISQKCQSIEMRLNLTTEEANQRQHNRYQNNRQFQNRTGFRNPIRYQKDRNFYPIYSNYDNNYRRVYNQNMNFKSNQTNRFLRQPNHYHFQTNRDQPLVYPDQQDMYYGRNQTQSRWREPHPYRQISQPVVYPDNQYKNFYR
jgi:outer membrane murein-binding lipoprotein Lpp